MKPNKLLFLSMFLSFCCGCWTTQNLNILTLQPNEKTKKKSIIFEMMHRNKAIIWYFRLNKGKIMWPQGTHTFDKGFVQNSSGWITKWKNKADEQEEKKMCGNMIGNRLNLAAEQKTKNIFNVWQHNWICVFPFSQSNRLAIDDASIFGGALFTFFFLINFNLHVKPLNSLSTWIQKCYTNFEQINHEHSTIILEQPS